MRAQFSGVGNGVIDEHPRAVDRPELGTFKLRLVRGGPWVPAAIEHDDAGWRAIINGATGAPHSDPAYAPGVFTVWHGGRRISAADYALMLETKRWAEAEMREHPAANPSKPIDISKLDSLF